MSQRALGDAYHLPFRATETHGQFWRMAEARRLVDPMTLAALSQRRTKYARAVKNGVRMYPRGIL